MILSDKLELWMGDDEPIQLTLQTAAGVAINITGYRIKFVIKKDFESNSLAVYFKEIASGDITNPSGGIHTYTIPHSVTGLWTAGDYYYQVQWITSANLVSTMIEGPCTVYKKRLDNITT